MRITIANAKGGVGKTTSAIYLAQAAALKNHRAVVLDADPQGSASQWADMAAQENQPLDFNVLPANPATLKRPRTTRAIEIVDAAPTGTALAVAMETADFTIIPCSDSPLDVQQAWATLETAKTPAAILLVRVEQGTKALIRGKERNDTPPDTR